MPTYSEVTGTIGQKGRRGALMLSLDVSHPDIEEFIDIKTDLNQVTKANISVKVTDTFMDAVVKDKDFTCSFEVEDTGEVIEKVVRAKDLFMKLCKNNHDFAEPGILYWDNIRRNNIMSECEDFEYAGVNPCLVGSTKIQTVEGEIPIKELVGKQPYVYCMDEDTRELDIKQATKVWLTKKNASLVKINHLRGTLICTPDHQIYTRNRGWVEAQHLQPKDKLVGLNRCMKDEKHSAVALSGQKKYTPEHRFILGKFQDIKGMNVHHLNDNPLDNRLSNLEALTHSEHSRLTNTGRVIESIRDDKGRYVEKPVKTSRETLTVNKENTGLNWLVQSVEVLNYTEDVYDMTVEDHHNFVADGIIVHNCAEEPLPGGGSCLLGSINLSEFVINPFTKKAYFDEEGFKNAVDIAIIGLNEVLDEGLPLHPLQVQRDTVRDLRQIGLGVMGIADMLIKMGVGYGSTQSILLCENVAYILKNQALYTSSSLAKRDGVFPNYEAEDILKSKYVLECDKEVYETIKEDGLRNSQVLTIAPTGSLSTMLGISGGIEPIFNTSYTRKTESLGDGDQYYTVYTPIIAQYMKANGLKSEDELPSHIKTTAMNLEPSRRVKMQSIWQRDIDASISSTVNLPYEATVEDVFNIYVEAWREGLKGITIFRDGCKRCGILTNEAPKEEPTTTEKDLAEGVLDRGEKKDIAEDTVYYKRPVYIGCGKLNLFIGYSPSEGLIQDLYIKKSGNGGCEKNLETTVIGMSLVLRLGGTLDMIDRAFSGISTCSSFTSARSKGKPINKGAFCGNAIMYTIKDFLKNEAIPVQEVKEAKLDLDIVVPTFREPVKPKCPECGEPISMIEGCMTCPVCGYSKCN